MLKVACCGSSSSSPRTLQLAGRDPFIPVALQPHEPVSVVGWEAYARRRLALGQTAFAFRDRLSVMDASMSVSGQAADGLTLQQVLFASLKNTVERSAGNSQPLAVSIPDDWFAPRWSLPVALQSAGWTPRIFVRESIAALSVLDGPRRPQLLLLSLGAGSARGAVCRMGDDDWRRIAWARDDRIAGNLLRARLVRRISNRIVQQFHRDPREDGPSDQAVHDGVDEVLIELHRKSSATLRADVHQHNFECSVSRDEVSELGKDFREPLEQLVSQLLSDAAVDKCPVVVWGELASLLPTSAWLARFCPRGEQVSRLPLDAIAAGTARLGAWHSESQWEVLTGTYAALCPQCGEFSPKLATRDCPRCCCGLVPLAECGTWGLEAPAKQMPACLVLQTEDVEQRKEIRSEAFRLGRNPISEWVFTDPIVSSAHASIFWDGNLYRIVDLDSINGTFVNRRRVNESVLKHGDQIQLGRKGPLLRIELNS